ncbi:exopolysaccharide biosynthesis polyprenyl glycosylphosphotransferase [Pseudoalteromonas sp. B95]|nr:exopolysaccharide biosynthesis polyprenyl glycosylphosphotransferase [Pseudoalteromonas sp. B95]MDK1289589.1 exopolysaccharide biosynthesis polyprenyl glycosylphosphotransferase [Pseudoalteromonas sp. B95]
MAKLDKDTTVSVNGLSIKKRFRTKTHALNQKTIYVYCPDNRYEKIQNLAKQFDFDVVINDYSITDITRKVICHYESAFLSEEKKAFLVTATELGGWVEPLVSYLDGRLGYTEVELLGSSYFLHQKAFSILSTKRTQIAKRVIDLAAAITLLLFTLPISIITALLIKLESKGPVFYKQKRTGLYNEEFEVIKFRSMAQNAEASGAQWAKKNDSRVTKVGKFIRKTRIDELPQIINILRGEMSIVGPRPEREFFIKNLEKEIPYYRFRHAVKPGITGLAQVCFPYGESLEDAIWKHKYDTYYIKHHSTFLDLKILLKTVKVVIFGMGR